jgi:hypothetical protein
MRRPPRDEPAGRISTIFNSAARMPRLAHPKLRTAPRKRATPRGPDRATLDHMEH